MKKQRINQIHFFQSMKYKVSAGHTTSRVLPWRGLIDLFHEEDDAYGISFL